MKKLRAFSLLEMLVVLISATLVGSMALHLMMTCVKSVNQRMSVVSRIDRLRLLESVIERDIDSRFPEQEKGAVRIGAATSGGLPQRLISARVLIQETSPQVSLEEVEYLLEKEDLDYPGISLFRRLKSQTQPPIESARILFRLEEDESLTWSATPEVMDSSTSWTRLHLVLEDRRYRDFPVMRDMLLEGKIKD